MASYPRAFEYFSRMRLPIARQTVKVLSSTPQTAVAGDTIAFNLPSSTMVDLRSIAVSGLVSTESTGNGFTTLPRHVESLCEVVGLEVGGQTITSTSPYWNMLFNLFAQFQLGDRSSIRNVLSYGGAVENPTADLTDAPFTMMNWIGFLATSSTQIIHTGLLPQVRLLIRLAPNSVLVNSANVTASKYTLKDLNMTCQTYAFLDGGIWDNKLAERVSESPLTISWVDYSVIQGSVTNALTNSHRFNLACSSLDALHAWYQRASFASHQQDNLDEVTETSSYFTRSHGGVSRALKTSQFSVNSTLYPSFGQASMPEAFVMTLQAQGYHLDTVSEVLPGLNNLTAYVDSAFVHTVRFNHIAHPTEQQTLSGINTVSSSANLVWQTTGLASDDGAIPMVAVEHTRQMTIAGAKQVSFVI